MPRNRLTITAEVELSGGMGSPIRASVVATATRELSFSEGFPPSAVLVGRIELGLEEQNDRPAAERVATAITRAVETLAGSELASYIANLAAFRSGFALEGIADPKPELSTYATAFDGELARVRDAKLADARAHALEELGQERTPPVPGRELGEGELAELIAAAELDGGRRADSLAPRPAAPLRPSHSAGDAGKENGPAVAGEPDPTKPDDASSRADRPAAAA